MDAAPDTRGTHPVGPSVLVVDGWLGFAEALAALLTRAGLAAQPASLTDAGEAIASWQPDVLLLDGEGEASQTRALVSAARLANESVVILLLLAAAAGRQSEALTAATGADLVLSRDVEVDRVVEATRKASAQSSATRKRRHVGVAPTRRAEPDPLLAPSLSPRENDVLRGMKAGLPNAGIAAHLGISPHTVRTHVQRILGKLGAHHRLEAVAIARRAGLFSSEQPATRERSDAFS